MQSTNIRIRCSGYILRMNAERITKQLLNMKDKETAQEEAEGRAMVQVISHWPLTAEAWVRVWVNPCGICGGQSGTGTGFSPNSFPVNISFHRRSPNSYHLGNA
jgi:hypothetical protein